MQVSLEFLYHFRCDRCSQWWTIADIEPKIGADMSCPHCQHLNIVENILTFRETAKSTCLEQKPDPQPDSQILDIKS
jgi:DNA-directed RNA polymerase subunit RPC12/RpoP